MGGDWIFSTVVLLAAAAAVRVEGACAPGWTKIKDGCVLGIDEGTSTASPDASSFPAIPDYMRRFQLRRLAGAPCPDGWTEIDSSCTLALDNSTDEETSVPLISGSAAMKEHFQGLRAPVSCGRPEVRPLNALPVAPAKVKPPVREVTATEAFPGSWPWMTSVLVKFDGSTRKHCTGTLLSKEWMLTAADCINDEGKLHRGFQVRLGVHDLREVLPAEQRREVTEIVMHPEYQMSSKDKNLALLRLSAPVEFTSLVMPVCLPAAKVRSPADSTLISAGWDRPEFVRRMQKSSAVPVRAETTLLQQTPLNMTDFGACTRQRGASSDTLCTKRSVSEPWQRISGDPLFHFQNRKSFTLVGMAFDSGECSSTTNCNFLQIEPHVNWITRTIGTRPSDTVCGKPSVQPKSTPPRIATNIGTGDASRIVGGEEARPNSWPWQVSILIPEDNAMVNCGGTLINEQWVVSAAHCFLLSTSAPDLKQVQIRLGAHNLERESSGEQRRYPSRIFTRKFGEKAFGDDDIVLLKLNRPVSFGRSILPVCLAPKDSEYLVDGDKVYGTGWGVTQQKQIAEKFRVLRQMHTTIVDFDKCKNAYTKGWITDNMLCAGNFTHGGVSTCQGDSGGPLVYQTEDGTFYLVGVTSWATGCARPRFPNIYTRVSRYRDWIDQMISGGQRRPALVPTAENDRTLGHNVRGTEPATATEPATDAVSEMTTSDLESQSSDYGSSTHSDW